jgi:hypothetical protein
MGAADIPTTRKAQRSIAIERSILFKFKEEQKKTKRQKSYKGFYT